jgi:hypothetical protein
VVDVTKLGDGLPLKVMVEYPWVVNPNYREGEAYYIVDSFEAEVLTVHFEKGTMRVRILVSGKKVTFDTDVAPFFELFQITAAE